MNVSTKPKALITHPWMARGGSEATAMSTIEALQDDFDVTFATMHLDDWDGLNGAYGTSVDPQKITVVKVASFPGLSATRLVYIQRKKFEREVRNIEGDFDICISTYNPVDFGRPGIQLIGDFSFSEELRSQLYPNQQDEGGLIRDLYLKLGELVGVETEDLSARGDLILANSDWSRRMLSSHFNFHNCEVIYPPVPEAGAPLEVDRDPFGFACLGRISPEKGIENIIQILAEVRKSFPKVTLQLVGGFDDSDYSREIESLANDNKDWITCAGFLDAKGKIEVFSKQSFALHACTIEAFGIAVAEMASLGCVPFVPVSGGAKEIVPFEELHFSDIETGVARIKALLENTERIADIRAELIERTEQFAPKEFARNLRRHVSDFMAKDAEPLENDDQKSLSAAY